MDVDQSRGAGSTRHSSPAKSGASAPLVRDGARAIALLGVADVDGDPSYPLGYELRLERTIKGSVPGALELPAPLVSLCGDRLAVKVNSRVLLAFDVTVADQVITPSWEFDDRGEVTIGSGPDEPGDTLESVIGRLSRPEASVSTDPGTESSESSFLPAAVVATLGMAGFGLFLRWRQRAH